MQTSANLSGIVEKLGIRTTGFWIKQLSTLPPHQIGVIKMSGKLLAPKPLEQLCQEVAFLANKVTEYQSDTNGGTATGFYLPMVVGGGIQYDELLGMSPGKVNGIRVTPQILIDEMAPIALHNQQVVVSNLKDSGVDAVAISPSIFKVKYHGDEICTTEDSDFPIGAVVPTDYVGDIDDVAVQSIIQAIMNHRVPVITHIGYVKGKNQYQPVNINATTVAKELVSALQAMKLIMLGNTPIHDSGGNMLPGIYSEQEALHLINTGIIGKGAALNVKEAYDVLHGLRQGSCVQLTSLKGYTSEITSTGLLEELLGNGSGTKIDKPYAITDFPFGIIPPSQLTHMINAAFGPQGKTLVDEYFSMIAEKKPTIYMVNENWGGAITYPVDGAEYICKLFTHEDYQGLGIARNLISKVLMQKGAVAWRTSNKNGKAKNIYDRIAAHYNGEIVTDGQYSIYMLGVPSEKHNAVVGYISDLPATLKEVI